MATSVMDLAPVVADDFVVCDAVAITASVRQSLDCDPLLDVDPDMLPE